MIDQKLDPQACAMLSTARRFVEDFFPSNVVSHKKLETELQKGNGLERLKIIVNEELQSKKAQYSLYKDYSIPNVEEATWNVLNVLFRLHDKLRLLRQTIGLEALRNLIEDCVVESDIPNWLKGRISTHLPTIVLQEFGDQALISKCDTPNKPYVVYCGSGLPFDCDAAELLDYRKLGGQGHFDIFIDDVPPQKIVLVRGERGKITPGRGLPYKVLRYLLSRVGREVSYGELRQRIWTLRQSQTMSGLSKTLYDKLGEIRTQLRKASLVSDNEPDKWFQKTSVRGVIYVWEGLNSCLITAPVSLRPHLK